MLSFLLLVTLAVATQGQGPFGGTCVDGTYSNVLIPEVAALASQYPPVHQVASILPSDSAARELFNSIQGDALNFRPTTLNADGAPLFTGYDVAADPQAWWSASGTHVSKIPGIPTDSFTCPSPNTWGLGIDDGPSCSQAPLHDLLRTNNIRAALFYIGSNVAAYSNEAKRAFENGHEICCHSWSHQTMTSLTNEQMFAELYYCKKIIKDVLGVSTRCWRPPYGDIDDRLRLIANALELQSHVWSDDPDDFRASNGPEGLATATANYLEILADDFTTAGTTVLTHELLPAAVQLFLTNFPAIRAKFSHIVPAVSGCANVSAVYAEPNAPAYPVFADILANRPAAGPFRAPAQPGTSGPVVLAGQAAFLQSLNAPTNVTTPRPSGSILPSPSGPVRQPSGVPGSLPPRSSTLPTTLPGAASHLTATLPLALTAILGLVLLA